MSLWFNGGIWEYNPLGIVIVESRCLFDADNGQTGEANFSMALGNRATHTRTLPLAIKMPAVDNHEHHDRPIHLFENLWNLCIIYIYTAVWTCQNTFALMSRKPKYVREIHHDTPEKPGARCHPKTPLRPTAARMFREQLVDLIN